MSAVARLAALLFFAAPGGPGDSSPFPVWLQTDARWASVPVRGEPKATLGQIGCAVTSVAMLLRGLGRTLDGRPVDPLLLNARIERLQLEGMAAAAGLRCRLVERPLTEVLAQGPLIVEIRYRAPPDLGGQVAPHFVLAVGLDARHRVVVHDPMRGRRTLDETQPLDRVVNAFQIF